MEKEPEKIIDNTNPNLGYNVKRLREILGIKQETLASKIGITQTKLSRWESKEILSEQTLTIIANAMGIDKDVIKNYKDGMITFRDFIAHDTATAIVHQIINNPIEKICELYERLLDAEKEKNEILRSIIQDKN